jgi:hypothetical protein
MLYTLKTATFKLNHSYFHELFKNTEGITLKVLHIAAKSLLFFRVSFNEAVNCRW